jgi:Ca2+-dependent lipid-binding protein
MNPYIKFKYNGKKYRTKTMEGADIRPKWDQIIPIEFVETEPRIRIRIHDDNNDDDAEIGMTTLPIKDVMFTYNEEVKLPVERDGNKVGYIICMIIPPEEAPEEKVD